MNRQEIVALKLQMGIDPSAKILPNVLLAMWQQLKIESGQAAQSTRRDFKPRSPDFHSN